MPDSDPILSALSSGTIELKGQFVWGSNYTFLVQVTQGDETRPAVYKPARGERPLWDFPEGTLAQREVAAYVVSRALGWDLVPPTVLRPDGPAGAGSLQLFVDADPERHYFTFTEAEKQRLRPVAVFDLLINNADRKGGHVLLGESDHLWLIDHGVCFHAEDKLRTVIWDFVGEPIPRELLAALRRLRQALLDDDALRTELGGLLAAEEVEALQGRADRLLRSKRFPPPGADRPYPWPLV
ncbi:MAG: SCO1664 family protein [Anaerolineales bacterium]|nr:SCO1664 family protein [Anaerolineales bacterium]